MEFLNSQKQDQLYQILTNRTLLRTADADLRSAVLNNCGLGKYSALLPLDATSFQFVVSLCAKLSEVYIAVKHSESEPKRLGLIVFLEYLSHTDPNLSAEDKEFLEYVIAKWNLDRKEQGQGTLKDASLNRLLKKLEQHQPRLIGLDLYRDFETAADEPNLVARFSNERFFAVCKVPETDDRERVVAAGIDPPDEVVQEERFGFSDFIPDSDQVVRRFLMAQEKVSGAEDVEGAKCATRQSFSLALARRYLELEGSQSNKYEYKDPFESQKDLQIGNAIFKQLQPFTGGYQDVDASGYQVLLNYRATGENLKAIAKHVSLEDVLNDRLSEQDVRDKIVLIGITAKVAISDDWFTPYGTMSGVFVQAHMISQILSFAKGERLLLKVWLPGIEFLWIGCWSLVGAGLAYYLRFSWRMIGIAGGATFLVLYVTCLCLLTWGSLWVPLVPSAMSLFLTGGTVLYMIYRPYRKISDPMTKS
ncbi:CHASE2 domain-containing protein [Coleofasciculus sp.]|uniref:CHASE2 domain-containing protein n=1 Tax=Coleofasciculus sp. TaxID=3100458 RepID=UPI0039F9508C